MKEYWVTITYLVTVEADNEEDAKMFAQTEVDDGKWLPNDIEVEEAN